MKRTLSAILALCLMLFAPLALAAPDAPAELPLTAEDVHISAAVLQDTARVSDLIDNDFTHWMQEQTGIVLDITPVTSDVAAEKLNLMLNSGDYPQMFLMSMSYSNLQRYGMEEGILLPITDLIGQYGYYYNIVAERYPAILTGLTMSDGQIYGMTGVQRSFHGLEQSGKLYLNVSWLAALGLEVPTTTEEFAEVLRAFKKDDPNGNGAADEIPMSGSNSWNGFPHEMLMNAFCHYNNARILMYKDDAFVPQYIQDGFQDGLAYVAELYAEALIDPAAYTQTDAMLAGLVDSDNGLVGAMNLGHLYMSQAMGSEVNRDWEMILPLVGPNGYQGVPYNDTVSVSNAYVTFTDKCDEAALALAFQWADLLFSDEGSLRAIWGPKDEIWAYIEEPGLTMLSEPAEFELLDNPHAVVGNFRWYIQGCGQNDFNTRFAVRSDIYSNAGSEARLGQQTAALKPYWDDYKWPTFQYSAELSEEISLIETSLKTAYDQWTLEFITGSKSVERDWEAFLSEMQTLEIDRYIELVTQGYQEYQNR